jgi:hypothetical protein
MKKWRNNPEFPNTLTWSQVSVWLSRNCGEGDVIELTGGEPGKFYQLDLLLDCCLEKKYRVILRTNGLALKAIDRKKYPNMIVVLAKHDTDNETFEDMKQELCQWDLIQESLNAFVSGGVVAKFNGNTLGDPGKHEFTRMASIYPDGKVAKCNGVVERATNCSHVESEDSKPYENLNESCAEKCPLYLGAWELAAQIPGSGEKIQEKPAFDIDF